MKGFALNDSGDVVIERNDVKLAYDTELLSQKIRQVLETNRGEWWADPKEGVPVQKILVKNPNPAVIRDYIRSAIYQVDRSLKLTRCEIRTSGRRLEISFTAADGNREINTEVEA